MSDVELSFATLFFAAGAGLLSFLSPCVLPLLPAYLSYISGLSAEQLAGQQSAAARAQVLSHSVSFVIGLAVVFAVLGAAATLIGRFLVAQYLGPVTQLAGLMVMLFGLHLTGLVRLPLLYREARFDLTAHRNRGLLGALLMGAAFAAGWTPCVGPFLASLLGLASQSQTVAEGILLLFVYGLGLGVPFVLAGVALERTLRLSRALRPRLQAIERGSGVLLLGMGLLLLTNQLALISGWLTQIFGNGLAM